MQPLLFVRNYCFQLFGLFSYSYEASKLLMSRGQFEDAISELNRAVSLYAHDESFYVARAECFINLCDLQSAILNYRKAYLLVPDGHRNRLAFLYFTSAESLAEQNLHEEALEYFSQAIELNPDAHGYHIRR